MGQLHFYPCSPSQEAITEGAYVKALTLDYARFVVCLVLSYAAYRC